MPDPESPPSRARRLLGTSVVWDNHGCMPMRADDSFLPQLARYRAAGMNMVSLNVGYGQMGWDKHLAILTCMRRWLSERSDAFQLVSCADDVAAAKAAGRLGIAFDVEGMVPIEDDPGRVQVLHDLGVRWMLVAYNRNNRAGGGCLDDDEGLTQLGRDIIAAMDRAGMVLCLSHSGQRTAFEALETTRNPAILSHSNPFGHTPHPRNVSDGLIRACAARGGVVGLSGIGPFLGAERDLVAALLRQLRYVMDLVGPQHVGLGLDYVFDRAELEAEIRAHPNLQPAGMTGSLPMIEPEAIGSITEGLCRQGWSDQEIADVLGGNWLRIARQVWP